MDAVAIDPALAIAVPAPEDQGVVAGTIAVATILRLLAPVIAIAELLTTRIGPSGKLAPVPVTCRCCRSMSFNSTERATKQAKKSGCSVCSQRGRAEKSPFPARTAARQAALAAGADELVPKAELVTDLLPAIRRVTQANRSR